MINLLLSDFEKNTIKAPITVDKPAKSERKSGIKHCLSNIIVSYKLLYYKCIFKLKKNTKVKK